MSDARIYELARCQAGLLSRQQTLSQRIPDSLITRRVAAGRLLIVAPGVYSLPGWPDSWHRRLWLAHLDVGLHSVVSHEAAAALHRLTTYAPGPVTVTVPHGDHERPAPYEVRQSTDLRSHHVTTVDGLPTTTPARTLVDLASRRRPDRLARALDDELRRPGKRGMRLLGRLLAARGPGYVPPESVLERRLLNVLAAGGLPAPVCQAPLPWRPQQPSRVDFLYPAQRVIIEADGRRWHSRTDQLAADRRRDRDAQNHGYGVYRFVWEEITKQPDMVCDTIRTALTRAEAA
jgi:hypothetical protein